MIIIITPPYQSYFTIHGRVNSIGSRNLFCAIIRIQKFRVFRKKKNGKSQRISAAREKLVHLSIPVRDVFIGFLLSPTKMKEVVLDNPLSQIRYAFPPQVQTKNSYRWKDTLVFF